jgi:pyruvyltransferase
MGEIENSINIRWSGPHKPNWGDELNKTLIKLISGKDPLYIKDPDIHHYLCAGSILRWSHKNTTVWGSGFISSIDTINEQPDIRAVRGPLSREMLLKLGFNCPPIYGDPALLYPRFYQPNVSKKYKYGIIPHYIDQANSWLEQYKNSDSVKIINILDPTINTFVDEINECEVILSSSLHGLICADSYGIPSYWIKLSTHVIGGDFKFIDYFKSVNRPDTKPILINNETEIKNMKFHEYRISIDLDLLYNECPFKQ